MCPKLPIKYPIFTNYPTENTYGLRHHRKHMIDDPPNMIDQINYIFLFSSIPLLKSFLVAICSHLCSWCPRWFTVSLPNSQLCFKQPCHLKVKIEQHHSNSDIKVVWRPEQSKSELAGLSKSPQFLMPSHLSEQFSSIGIFLQASALAWEYQTMKHAISPMHPIYYMKHCVHFLRILLWNHHSNRN